MQAIVRDISERKRVDDMLRENTAKLQLTFDAAPICIATVGLDKRFLNCNRAFCDFVCYSEDELKQKTINDITLPEDADIGMADLRAIAMGEIKAAVVQKRYVRKDGKIVWGEVHINLIRNSEGKPMYFLPVIQDITKRKQAEEELRQKMEELRASNDELEQFNRGMVGRELRMIELKEEINELCRRLGEPLRHATDQLQTDSVPGAGPAPAPPGGGGT
jgi:PAS domain S-box-containing protein